MTLEFRLGPIPIRIDPWFLVVALVVGLGAHRGPAQVALWAGGFLATVLLHELGHVVAARSFGFAAEVNLSLLRTGFARRVGSLSVPRTIAVCLAGPAVSLGTAAMVFAIDRVHPTGGELTGEALLFLGWVNLAWGLLNLVPILPLDAGDALVALLDGATKGHGEPPARWLSIALAAAIGVVAAHYRTAIPVLLCAVLALQNVRALRSAGSFNREAIVRVHLRAAFDALEHDDAITATDHCRTVLATSVDPAVRRDAVRLLAYAYASMGLWSKLMALLESGGVRALEIGELEKYERVARELGRSEEAQRMAWLRSRMA